MGVFTYLRRDLEQIFFPDRDQHPIPTMDGALTPNDRLDAIPPIGAPIPGADDAALGPDGALYVSAQQQILRLSGEGFAERSVLATFDGAAGGLAFHPDGRLLVCVAGEGLAALGADGRTRWLREAGGRPLANLTDVAATPEGAVFLAEGSSRNPPERWLDDLMQKNALGSLISCTAGLTGPKVLLSGLQFPYGLTISRDGQSLAFTESWSHRLSRAKIDSHGLGPVEVVIGNMPGYPARLSPASRGGFWLSVFAVRTHLTEFVLREDEFRAEMMQTIPRHLWVGPALETTNHCHEPMQSGNVKALGIEKPWAPPRSYGLLARIDDHGEAIESLHSRYGGANHGITAACETPQGLVVVSKGGGRVLLDTTAGRTS